MLSLFEIYDLRFLWSMSFLPNVWIRYLALSQSKFSIRGLLLNGMLSFREPDWLSFDCNWLLTLSNCFCMFIYIFNRFLACSNWSYFWSISSWTTGYFTANSKGLIDSRCFDSISQSRILLKISYHLKRFGSAIISLLYSSKVALPFLSVSNLLNILSN